MSLSVTIEKQSVILHNVETPIESSDIAGLLTALKTAKTEINELLSELVVAEKAMTATTTQPAKSVEKADGKPSFT